MIRFPSLGEGRASGKLACVNFVHWNVLGQGEASVGNGSRLVVRFRVRVGTELEPLQRVSPHQNADPHQTRGSLAGASFSLTQNFGSSSVFEL